MAVHVQRCGGVGVGVWGCRHQVLDLFFFSPRQIKSLDYASGIWKQIVMWLFITLLVSCNARLLDSVRNYFVQFCVGMGRSDDGALSFEIIARNSVDHAMSNMVLCNLNCNTLYVFTSVHIAIDFGSLHHHWVNMQFEYWEQKSAIYIGHIE